MLRLTDQDRSFQPLVEVQENSNFPMEATIKSPSTARHLHRLVKKRRLATAFTRAEAYQNPTGKWLIELKAFPAARSSE